jgi:hypothetical protein
MILIGLMTILLCSFILDQKLPLSLKRYSFILSISLISLLLYYFTFQIGFFHAQHIIYFAGAAILIWDCLKSKLRNLTRFLLGNKVFCIGSLLLLASTLRGEFSQWDEFSWGAFAKHINYFGTYWNADSAILPQHMRYMPGLSLWENFFLSQGQFSEGPVYFSLALIFLCGLIALWPKIPSWLNILVTLLLFLSTTTWFSTGLTTIYVDATMGLLMGLIILAIDDVEHPRDFWVPVSLILFLALTKESGLILALICFFMMTVKSLRQKNFNKSGLSMLVGGIAALYLNYFFWKLYLQANPGMGAFDSATILQKIEADLLQMTSTTHDTLINSGKALLSRSLPYTISQSLNFIGSWVFWTVLFLLLFVTVKKKYEILLTFLIGLCGYTLFLIFAYLYFFTGYQQQILVSFERYLGVFFMAFSLIAIRFIVEGNLYKSKKIFFPLLALLLIYRPTPSIFLPINVRRDVGGLRKDLRPLIAKIENLTPPNAKVWFVWQNSNGLEAMIVRYEIMPRHMNPGDWSLGDPYYPGDIWTFKMSLTDFEEASKNYDYLVLGKTDTQFNQQYGALFSPSPPLDGLLYRKGTSLLWSQAQ